MDDSLKADYVRTFNTPHGRRVLIHLEKRAYSATRIDQRPNPKDPNPAYMNPNAAMYRAGQIDVIKRIQRELKSMGVDTNAAVPDDIEEHSLED